jgi:Spy/CpxP family protein refolding chaperone
MMGDSMHDGTWMDMMAMMPGGDHMMSMPMSSLMQRVMRLQPAFVLTHSDALDLTHEQVAQLEAIVSEQEAAHQEHMRSMFEDTQSLVEMFESDDVDVEDIRTLAEGAMRPFRALQWRAITDARAVRELLTAAQREKTNSLPFHRHMMNNRPENATQHPGHQHNR